MMTLSRHVLPFFHQSTIIVIDDDREFLESFRSRFRRRMLCRAFGDPEEAIRHIRKTTPRMPRHSGCVVPGDLVSSDGDQAVVFRPAVIRDLMHDANRFEEVSVAVIDYDMPGINGLEVCRRLRDLPLRKVMLTGAADEKLAMGAFNEGLIDRFVLKQEADAVDRLEEVIHQLQVDYFGRIGNELSSLIGLNESAFLVDPVFHKYFDMLMERENAVEYFLSENPPGLQLVRGDGVVRTLLVQHYGALAVYAVAASGQPPGLNERISAGNCQPWFPTEFGFYSKEYYSSWRTHLYPAERVGPWYCSVIDGIPGRKLKRPVPSYQDYRRKLYQGAA